MVIEIIVCVLLILFAFFAFYLSTLSKLKISANDIINYSEDLDIDGKEKMKIAVEKAKKAVPFLLRLFFGKNKLEKIVQEVFDKMEEYAKKQVIGEDNKNGS